MSCTRCQLHTVRSREVSSSYAEVVGGAIGSSAGVQARHNSCSKATPPGEGHMSLSCTSSSWVRRWIFGTRGPLLRVAKVRLERCAVSMPPGKTALAQARLLLQSTVSDMAGPTFKRLTFEVRKVEHPHRRDPRPDHTISSSFGSSADAVANASQHSCEH